MKLTKENFMLLINEAGFKTKKDFARFINLPYNSINNWGNNRNKFPRYVTALMIALIKSHKYDNLINSNSIALENENLRKEISDLKEKINELELRLSDFKNLQKSLGSLKEYINNV
ncbi:hypothetical protein LS72_005190 [Helicobacter apodemus]|uniref:Uncharacterized protein n=1 Tax=Helicobacter apodemus TaxID=135569 RepID=A0A4U8UE79_9HELI|nr:hypothetical protein [Helicobacter apodemus]TLE15955.1 hypothetical protein LS72_005190 [Helicobacter apodemus]